MGNKKLKFLLLSKLPLETFGKELKLETSEVLACVGKKRKLRHVFLLRKCPERSARRPKVSFIFCFVLFF